MSTGRQAPEIYAKPLSEFSGPGYPPVGTPEHEQTVVTTISLGYAAMGWNAAIVANAGVVRVVAVPHSGIQPLAYLEGLCAHGFIEDALPGLEALDGMVDDPDVAYTYGLALSELGRTGECLIPLNKCLRLDPGYDNAAIAIGVALSKLRRFDSSSHFKLAQRGGWRRLAHDDWRVWAIKIEWIPDLSENNAGKQCVMVLTSKLIEVSMIFGYPNHFHRHRHPRAEPRSRLDREGAEHVPSFARRASAEQRPAL
jgi:hypothetical protein